jgi:hypothetical protein
VPGGYQGYQGYPGYPSYPGYQAPLLPPGYQMPVPPPRAQPAVRPTGPNSVAMTFIALGSMTLGVAVTAILAHAQNVGGRGAMALLIWAIIAIINIVYARSR